ncbi:MAG: glycerol-3-phosphate 1-O-acyltransferase PlsY [Legionellales bacterium]|nr:glycerol-3-phosphate 1-O-acyltransferase PlsY [Legionellales bacterium]
MEIFSIILAYLIGSLSFSIIICKILKLPDPRTIGSKNAGATNVSRLTNKKISLLVLFLDVLKGTITIIFAFYLSLSPFLINMIAIAVVIGHIFPIFFNFKGGKGVATFLGILIVLSPTLSIVALFTWILVALLFKYSSLASITSALIVSICSFFICYDYFIGLTILSILLIAKHKDNIVRLIHKKENKLGARNTS